MSLVITWADVIAIAPELSTFPSDGQAAILGDVVTYVNVNAHGSQARALAAARYLAAHLATMSTNRRGATGPLQSIAVGGVSKTFAQAVGKSAYSATSYGLEYERRVRMAGGARLVVLG